MTVDASDLPRLLLEWADDFEAVAKGMPKGFRRVILATRSEECRLMAQVLAYEAAKQPVIACQTCNGHGMIGGWRVGDGYDAEPCPDCTTPVPPSGGVEAARESIMWLRMVSDEEVSPTYAAKLNQIADLLAALASSTPAEVFVPPTVEEICQRIRDDFHGVTPAEAEDGTGEAVAWVQPGYLAYLRRCGSFPMRFARDGALGYTIPLYATPPATAPDAGMVEAALLRLAVALHDKHYSHVTQWRPLEGDAIGLITQIDNMTAALAATEAKAGK